MKYYVCVRCVTFNFRHQTENKRFNSFWHGVPFNHLLLRFVRFCLLFFSFLLSRFHCRLGWSWFPFFYRFKIFFRKNRDHTTRKTRCTYIWIFYFMWNFLAIIKSLSDSIMLLNLWLGSSCKNRIACNLLVIIFSYVSVRYIVQGIRKGILYD